MDLVQLRYFVAAADTLHFGRAAAELGIAQSALSQAMQRLEKHLGTPLFSRARRSISLTTAGHVLRGEARHILDQVHLAERLTRRAASLEAPLRVCFSPWAAIRTLPRALRALQRRWPGVEVRLDERASHNQVERILSGQADLGILNKLEVESAGLELKPLEISRVVAAIPAGWPLARKRRPQLADLAELPFVMFPQPWAPQLTRSIETACRQAGFVPRVAQRALQPQTTLNLVAHELGVALIPESARHLKTGNVSLRAIEGFSDRHRFEWAIAWVPRSAPAPLRDFVALLENEGRTGLNRAGQGLGV